MLPSLDHVLKPLDHAAFRWLDSRSLTKLLTNVYLYRRWWAVTDPPPLLKHLLSEVVSYENVNANYQCIAPAKHEQSASAGL